MSKQLRNSQKRFAYAVKLFVEASSSGELPTEIQIIPTGEWNHPAYGEMKITSADITEMKRNFDDGVRLDLPITAGHDNGMSGGELPAVAWYKEVIDKGVNGLWAVPEWLSEGERLLRERSFKYFSSEFYSDYEDPETGQRRKNVLVGGALTNRPYFKEMQPVGAFSEAGIMSQYNQPMDLKTILAKKAEDLSADEKAYVREHKAELDADQQSAFESVLNDAPAGETDEEKAAREAKEAEDKAAADKAAADAAAEAERQASEKNKGKMVAMTYAEVAALKQAAEDGAKALQKIEASEREAQAGKLVFSDINKNGQFLPKEKEAVAKFLKTLSETQRDQFVNLISKLPKRDASLFKEIGDGGTNATSAEAIATEVKNAALAEVKASEGKLTYSAAVLKVFKEKPELKQRYDEALAEGSN